MIYQNTKNLYQFKSSKNTKERSKTKTKQNKTKLVHALLPFKTVFLMNQRTIADATLHTSLIFPNPGITPEYPMHPTVLGLGLGLGLGIRPRD